MYRIWWREQQRGRYVPLSKSSPLWLTLWRTVVCFLEHFLFKQPTRLFVNCVREGAWICHRCWMTCFWSRAFFQLRTARGMWLESHWATTLGMLQSQTWKVRISVSSPTSSTRYFNWVWFCMCELTDQQAYGSNLKNVCGIRGLFHSKLRQMSIFPKRCTRLGCVCLWPFLLLPLGCAHPYAHLICYLRSQSCLIDISVVVA